MIVELIIAKARNFPRSRRVSCRGRGLMRSHFERYDVRTRCKGKAISFHALWLGTSSMALKKSIEKIQIEICLINLKSVLRNYTQAMISTWSIGSKLK